MKIGHNSKFLKRLHMFRSTVVDESNFLNRFIYSRIVKRCERRMDILEAMQTKKGKPSSALDGISNHCHS